MELINQPIDVLVAFMKSRVMPLSFSWDNHKYSIEKVNMTYSRRIGRTLCHIFAVTASNSYFKLCFNTEKNKWILEEAYYGI